MEFAAHSDLDRTTFAWGDDLKLQSKWMANTWHAEFPLGNTKEDGYATTAPVGTYPANGFGLSSMAGNVWEWCADWYHPNYYSYSSKRNPTGPPASYDPAEPKVPKHVQRGGSFLCSDDYCKRYVPGGRRKGEPDSATNHVGFRC